MTYSEARQNIDHAAQAISDLLATVEEEDHQERRHLDNAAVCLLRARAALGRALEEHERVEVAP